MSRLVAFAALGFIVSCCLLSAHAWNNTFNPVLAEGQPVSVPVSVPSVTIAMLKGHYNKAVHSMPLRP
jgi:hypothetical protein